jgi:hypothetical protein
MKESFNVARSADAPMSDAARDYVSSQFSGPLSRAPFSKPDPGELKCCKCGLTRVFDKSRSYEDQCDCSHPDCLGQMFCNKWPSWRDG